MFVSETVFLRTANFVSEILRKTWRFVTCDTSVCRRINTTTSIGLARNFHLSEIGTYQGAVECRWRCDRKTDIFPPGVHHLTWLNGGSDPSRTATNDYIQLSATPLDSPGEVFCPRPFSSGRLILCPKFSGKQNDSWRVTGVFAVE